MRRFYLLLTLLVITACAAIPGTSRFDRGAMLRNLSENVAYPLVNDAATQSETLVQQVYVFRENPTSETLNAVRSQWLTTSLAWERAEVVALDADMTLLTQIDKWPSNEKFIEDFIAGDTAINVSFVAGSGSTSKGLPAVEYLIFDTTSDDAALLSRMQEAQRMAYLVAAAENVRDNVKTLQTFWSPEGGNYVATFASAELDDGDLQSSVSMSVNELVVLLEGMVQTELSIPLGSKSYGEPFPTAAEGWRSLTSTQNLIANLEGVRFILTGDSPTGVDGIGLNDYLDALNAMSGDVPLSQAINTQMDKAMQALQAIDEPLTIAIETDKVPVEKARDELRALLVLIKNDMASHLGVTITFNDSDGD
jgi:predicted lipoprotein